MCDGGDGFKWRNKFEDIVKLFKFRCIILNNILKDIKLMYYFLNNNVFLYCKNIIFGSF